MELKLKWNVKKIRKQNGKEVQVFYILVPAKVAIFLKDLDPYLDIEKKTITFRSGEKNE
jgi:hypothetical protein